MGEPRPCEHGLSYPESIQALFPPYPQGCSTAFQHTQLTPQLYLHKRPAAEGDSPVGENADLPSGILSTAGHEKPCGNPPGPSGKAKYLLATDSELVP